MSDVAVTQSNLGLISSAAFFNVRVYVSTPYVYVDRKNTALEISLDNWIDNLMYPNYATRHKNGPN